MSDSVSKSTAQSAPPSTQGVGCPSVGHLPPECGGLVRDLEAARKRIEELEQQLSFLDRRNPRYAPKLAAAVKAWQSVTNPKSKSPKTALSDWLVAHADNLELMHEDGTLNKTAIDECCKVANWKMAGGAPTTPNK